MSINAIVKLYENVITPPEGLIFESTGVPKTALLGNVEYKILFTQIYENFLNI